MIKKRIKNISALKDVVEQIHNCKASHIKEIAVIEKYGPNTVWGGVVHVFIIMDHPKTDICYAWSSPIEGSKNRRYYAVLKVPPVDSPEKAVRASIVHNHKIGKL
jgi:hypothetical protein